VHLEGGALREGSGGRVAPEYVIHFFGNGSKILAANICLTGIIIPDSINFSISNAPGSSDAHGQIPTELSMLNLSDLLMPGNNFTGTIPTGMVGLTMLSLEVNQLSGTIPATLFQLSPNLTIVELSRNKLAGSLPSEVGLYPKEVLSLYGNQLSGTLPSELFGLEMLKSLSLDDNKVGRLKVSWYH
jgi:Leucine-rich repeat (LRR) protein